MHRYLNSHSEFVIQTKYYGNMDCGVMLTVTMRLWVLVPVRDFFYFFSLFSLILHEKPIEKHIRLFFRISCIFLIIHRKHKTFVNTG